MHTTSLRKVGGSIMMAVPPALLDHLHLQVGTTVGLTIEQDRLIVQARPRPSYTLDELLAKCDETAPTSTEDRPWIDAAPIGNELL